MKRFQTFLPFFCGVLIYSADQWLKLWSLAHLPLYLRKPILGQDILILSRVANTGLAGSYFSALRPGEIDFYIRYLPTAIILALGAFTFLRWRSAKVLERIGYMLMLGGGLSNLIDHWRSFRVVDTLQIWIGAETYLPFNLADLSLMGGMIILIITLGHLLWTCPSVSDCSSSPA